MQTFRRLNDGTRYYGLTWRGWLAAGTAGGLLYLAVRLSPLSYKPTISITLLVMTAAGMALYAVSGQALGPGRYVLAVIRWRFGPAQYWAPDEHEQPVSGGVLVDAVPLALVDASQDQWWWRPDEARLAIQGNGRIAHDAESENAP